jgi:hypothetical protein
MRIRVPWYKIITLYSVTYVVEAGNRYAVNKIVQYLAQMRIRVPWYKIITVYSVTYVVEAGYSYAVNKIGQL